ncbi:hypothetical protein [Hymenobacter seoulensis]
MKTSYWLFLVFFCLAIFQPFITTGTNKLIHNFLSDRAKLRLEKSVQAVFLFVTSFLALLGIVVLLSGQWNGRILEMSISENWLFSISLASVFVTVVRLIKERDTFNRNH